MSQNHKVLSEPKIAFRDISVQFNFGEFWLETKEVRRAETAKVLTVGKIAKNKNVNPFYEGTY